MRRLLRPLWFGLALLFLAEAWLWRHLDAAVRAIVAVVAFPALRARLARSIEALPPAATLLVFLVPVILLFPIKLLGLWMLARGSWFGAVAVLGLAKVVSMGVTAFIFDITRPKLLQLAWFRWLYERVLAGLAWAHARVDPFKARLRQWGRETLGPVRRRLRSLIWLLKPQRSGRFIRRVLRIRRRLHRPQPARG